MEPSGKYIILNKKRGKPAWASPHSLMRSFAHFGTAAMPPCGYIPYRGVCILPEVFYDIGNSRGISYIIKK
ncbi:hypothetical protein MCI89_22220 [Muricomes sp. OA1]|nr:hypothetical protein [Muricomes sp. OA1]